ncbi:hypothetical protein LAUMK35_03169 [Mycobacterium pseudokansasii]|uniref:Uncharacterized protein n=1 Tax=Mycobacterium pseudokansasii TaxID=2341080 RepID=A0A498QSR3_9MYCO|nr:hypothetical protein LAUMK35_03169 [Mycobacterium pseudokansasii]VAZ97283.1 hypothetical protein LAUMK21_03168 [Mycobacterium pseudokansasii]VBA51396.1 hypothetical protein LAUMK142_03081 [Mycobacterium pseudokansasii]
MHAHAHAVSATGDESSARWALMPLVPALPKGLVKRLVTVASHPPAQRATIAANSCSGRPVAP